MNPEAGEQAEQAQERQEAYEQAKEAGQGRPGPADRPGGRGPRDRLGRRAPRRRCRRRLGAGDRDRPARRIRLHARHPLRRQAVQRQLPDAVDGPRTSAPTAARRGTPAPPLCACKGSGQFDPIIEVVPNTGAVYAAYMNGFNVVFTKSTNHGATWSAPVKTYGNVSWNDKPTIATSDDGKDVYISFNGPTGGDPVDGPVARLGARPGRRRSWSTPRATTSTSTADVAADGTVYFAQTAILYGGGGNKGTTPTGQIEEHVFISRDRGATWENRTIASVWPGTACVADGCTPDFYLGHIALSADANGNLVALYDGATAAGGLQTIRTQRSTDGGRTWSSPVTLSATVGDERRARRRVARQRRRPGVVLPDRRRRQRRRSGTSGTARRPTAARRWTTPP